MIRAWYAMPASANPLFVSSPIVPLTWVPWLSMSRTGPFQKVKSRPLTRRDACRSGLMAKGTLTLRIAPPSQVGNVKLWLTFVIPKSTTAMMTEAFDPALTSQARGKSIAEKFHCRKANDGSLGVDILRNR